jgi:hypothetical protein
MMLGDLLMMLSVSRSCLRAKKNVTKQSRLAQGRSYQTVCQSLAQNGTQQRLAAIMRCMTEPPDAFQSARRCAPKQ